MNHIGRIAIFFLFSALLLHACKQPDPPEFIGLDDVQVSNLSTQSALLSAKLRFVNPNPFSLQLKKANVDFYFNTKHAGHTELDTTIEIPRRDSFQIPVVVQVDMHSLFSNALQFLLKKTVDVKVEGKLVLKKSGIRFSVPLLYEGTQSLDSLMPGGF